MAVDLSPEDGIKHLTKFGKFDELYVGGGTFSDHAMRYLWQTFPGEVLTPQVVILRRTRVAPASLEEPTIYRIEDEEVALRILGLDGITAWYRGAQPPGRALLTGRN